MSELSTPPRQTKGREAPVEMRNELQRLLRNGDVRTIAADIGVCGNTLCRVAAGGKVYGCTLASVTAWLANRDRIAA